MKLGDIIEIMIDRKINDLHSCLPAEITVYDATLQKASVKPLVKYRAVDDTDNDIPIINNVPVLMPKADNFYIHIPIKVGDKVLLFFSDYSIDEFLENGGKSTSTDVRNHSLNDAFALPMMNFWSAAISGVNADDFVINNGSMVLTAKKSGLIEIEGNVTTTGDVVADGISLKTHTHEVTKVKGATPGNPVLYSLTGDTGEPV